MSERVKNKREKNLHRPTTSRTTLTISIRKGLSNWKEKENRSQQSTLGKKRRNTNFVGRQSVQDFKDYETELLLIAFHENGIDFAQQPDRKKKCR
jgi:hypothetical protein